MARSDTEHARVTRCCRVTLLVVQVQSSYGKGALMRLDSSDIADGVEALHKMALLSDAVDVTVLIW